MRKCPICGSEYRGLVCAVCGFDASADREAYPTLVRPADARQAKSSLKNALKTKEKNETKDDDCVPI